PGPGSFAYDSAVFGGDYPTSLAADGNSRRYGPGSASTHTASYHDPGPDSIVGTDDDPYGPGADGADGTADDMTNQYGSGRFPGARLYASIGRLQAYDVPIAYDSTTLPPRI